jgi:uncharacterized protein (DUF934 family)
MPPLIRNRALAQDDWGTPEAEGAVTAGKRILPLQDFLQAMAAGASSASTGLLLKPEDLDLAPLQPFLSELPLIAVQFGSSGEGRGYTQARLLRERLGYIGELRARGAIRVDQIWFLARCGFDAFDMAEGEDAEAAIAQLDRFSVAYQPGPDGKLTHPRHRYG